MSPPNNLLPPQWLLRFFRWYCHPDYVEDIEGDLRERFERRLATEGVRKARWEFSKDILRLFRPGIIRSFEQTLLLNYQSMFRHNFLIAFRSFQRYRSSFLINLIGLSSGLACALLIFLWVTDELNVDKFFDHNERLYQVMQNTQRADGVETIEATPGLLAQSLKEELPEVAYSVSVIPPTFNASKGVISVDDVKIKTSGQYVSEDYLKVFSYKLLYGDRNQVLSRKNSIVISDDLAQKLFKSAEDALGQTIIWKTQNINGLCLIAGIFETPSANLTNQFDLLLNYAWFGETNPSNDWGSSSPRTYVLLKEGAMLNQFNTKIWDFIKTKDANSESTLFAQRYSDRYLYGSYENGMPSGGRIAYVRLFSIIAVFILAIACVNFMNLSTAKASRRLKEIGIKKAIGANRKSLIFQYLEESTLMSFLSLALAILLLLLLLPQFNQITGKQLALRLDSQLILSVMGITLFTGIIAGSYPAFYLSAFQPVAVLKGKLSTLLSGEGLRKGLVIFQFALSVMLIASVFIVYQQIELIQSKNLGYERDHILYFDTENMSNAFISEIENIPEVLQVGGGNLTAGSPLGGTNGIEWEGKSPDDNIFFSVKWVSYGLIETLGMEMVKGRSFLEDFGSPNQIIFNEKAMEAMGLTDPIGKSVTIGGEERQIVGIVKNFHFESLYEEVKPCVLLLAPMQFAPRISVKIQAGAEKNTIEALQKVYQAHNPELVFDFKFMDDDYQALYVAEQRVSTLSRYFVGIAILISCLGLFGLAAFTSERRLKEIGIRKILGANNLSIIRLLSSDFTKMVLVATFIGLPISYWIAQQWLEDFAYRIDLKWWYFIGAGLIALFIAWLTVGLQTIKAARVNPVTCLKDE